MQGSGSVVRRVRARLRACATVAVLSALLLALASCSTESTLNARLLLQLTWDEGAGDDLPVTSLNESARFRVQFRKNEGTPPVPYEFDAATQPNAFKNAADVSTRTAGLDLSDWAREGDTGELTVELLMDPDNDATLIASGVPILEALTIARDTAGNAVFKRAFDNIHGSIREGESIAVPLKEARIVDDIVVNMVDVGEETGALDTMMYKVAEVYDEEVAVAVDGLISMLEPLMVVVLGLIVGFIVIALFMPLVKLLNELS